MDFRRLRELVSVKEGRLEVTVDDFGSAALTESIKPFLEDEKLVVTDVISHDEDEDATSITIVGTGGARPFLHTEIRVVIRLLDDAPTPDDNVGISAKATADTGWKLSDLFAALKTAAIDDVVFKPPTTVYLTSYAGAFADVDELKTGMYLDATVDMEAVFNLWAFLLGSKGRVNGLIEVFEGVPNFVLAGHELNQDKLGFLPLSDLSWEIYCDPSYNAHELEWTVETYTGITCEIAFETQPDGTPKTHTLALRAFIYDPLRSVLFSVDFDDGIDAAIEELAALINHQVPLKVPFDGLEIEKRIRFNDFKVSVNPSIPKIEYVTFGVETDLEWQLIDEYLTLQEIDVGFRVDFPAGKSPKLSGSVSGLIGIGDAGTLELTAFFGTFALGGGLREGDPPLNIREAFQDFLDLTDEAADQLHLPDLEVTVFDFYIEPFHKTYRGDLELTGRWELPFVSDVALEHVAFKLDHPDAKTGVLFDAQAVFIVDRLFVGITSAYEGGEAGWTFTGSTRPGETIAVGTFLTNLAHRMGIDGTPPEPIAGLTLSDLNVGLRTKQRDFWFNGSAALPVAGKDVVLKTDVALTHYGEKDYVRSIKGQVTVAGLQFDVLFSRDAKHTFFVAAFQDTTGHDVNVGALLEDVTTDEALVDLGRHLSFTLKDALFAYERTSDKDTEAANHFLFALDMGFGVDLSGLPLVGDVIPGDEALRLVFTPLVASKAFTKDDAKALRELVPKGGTKLPDGAVAQGLALSITLRLGDESFELSFPVKVNSDSGKLEDTSGVHEVAKSDDGIKWFKIQKNLGPVHFERVGIRYKNEELSFLLDGSFSAAGLTLALYGLTASSRLDALKPHFSLDGIGVDYSNATVEIGGAFKHIPPTTDRPYDEYDGSVVMKAAEWSLSAIGSYAYVDGHPSLFVYAVLGMPLGGPPFFFVNGLALGFGYNRALVTPSIDEIKTFPLVAEALGAAESDEKSSALSGDASKKIESVIQALGPSVPPAIGEYFLAVGVKFSSFEIIDSFALLTVSFGNHFEIDLLGLSTAIIPTPEEGKSVPPMAEVQMAFKATFNPEEGVLSVQAKLTPASFLFSRDCHLTGGFALVTWFNDRLGHDGDFVLTLGGYHSHFDKPAHYPTVPRLGFSWKVSDQLSIKGDAYFALTPNAVMAGGHLDALWHDDALEAWFRVGADFLMAWKPYHYEASMYIDVGVEYTYHLFGTHHISVDAGADLSIWGPEFTGKARVHLWIVTFTVHFGAGSPARPAPLSWPQFYDSFLPDRAEVCSLSPTAGLVRTMPADQNASEPETWIIDPKTFRVSIGSLVPISHVRFGDGPQTIGLGSLRCTGLGDERALTPFVRDNAGGGFAQPVVAGDRPVEPGRAGIGPMAVAPDDLASTLTISIQRKASSVEADFGFVPLLKSVPTALWGEEAGPRLDGPALVADAVTGFDVVPERTHTPGETRPVDRRNLQYAVDGIDDAYGYAASRSFTSGTERGRDVIQTTLTDSAVAAKRRALLAAFGMHDPERSLRVTDTVAASLLEDPIVAAST